MISSTILAIMMSGINMIPTPPEAGQTGCEPVVVPPAIVRQDCAYEVSTRKVSTRRNSSSLKEPKAGVTPESSINGTDFYSTPPEGSTTQTLYRSGEAYYLDWFGQVAKGRIDGEMSQIAVTSDEVWIYNPFGKNATRSWIKGSLDDQGNVTVQTPQCVTYSYDQNSGKQINMYLINVRLQVDADGVSATYVEDTEHPTIKYKWDGKSLTLEEGTLGMCFWMPDTDEKADKIWTWYGVADLKQRFEPCPYTANVAPDDISYEDYVIDSYDYNTSTRQGDIIQIGFDADNNVWIKNLYKIYKNFCIKGEKDGSGYVFKTQYLGPVDMVGAHAFFLPGYYTIIDGVKTVGSRNEIRLDYDSATRTFTSPADTLSWYINLGKGDIRFLQCNENPTMKPYKEKASFTLENPVISSYTPADVENKVAGAFSFNISAFDTDGDYIDTQYLSYNIMLDDEPMILEPDVYLDLQSPLTDIPFGLRNYDINSSGTSRTLYIYRNDFKKIGVRLNYAKEGKRISSDIVYADLSGISDILTDNKITRTIYTDLLGRRIAAPSKGICIRTQIYEDGSRKSEKVAIDR